MSRVGIPRGWSPCVNAPASQGQGISMGSYFGQAVLCPALPIPPPGPAYFISYDWDACLIDGVHFESPDRFTADGIHYTSPNWPAGNYCISGGDFPFPNPGNAVDGLSVWKQQPDGTYICVAATGWYLFSGIVGTVQALPPPGIECTANDRPIPDGTYCDCCAGAPTNLGGVIYCTTYSLP